MSTTKTPPEEIAALEYLRARAAAEGIVGLHVGITLENPTAFHVSVDRMGSDSFHGWGVTFAEAIAELRSKLPERKQAALKLRQNAAELLRKAEAIEAGA